jgi:hypothetical protein
VANLVDFLFYKRKSFEGSLAPTPFFFLQVVTLECIFQLLFYCAEKDWLKRSTLRTQPWFSFLGGGRGGFFSLSEFEAVLDVSVLCCAACVRNERNLFSFFCFLFARRNKLRRYARMHSLPRSIAPSLHAAAGASPPLPPAPPPSPRYLRTEHINKRLKEPLETESQGAVLWLCKVVYYYLLGRKKEKGFCKLALA